MEELVVLDYVLGEVHLYPISSDTDIEMFIEEQGHDVNECYYMTSERIKLIKHV